ncbi:MAG: tetratricopeptide repeat protein [Pseudomonadota bacterium]|nr:tetratricopeptide repeat protein [Pseudomonadota bacterium]
MSWAILLLLIVTSLALLWLGRVRGSLLTLAAAALLFGAAGYALQGSPGLPGAPRTAADGPASPPLAGARRAFFGTFTPAEQWLILADSYARSGDTMEAAQVVQSALRAHPEDPELWTGYANALVDHGRMLTPAARLAFARAIALSPDSPGPKFFLGLAMMRSGDRAGALRLWQAVLASAPADASWRPMVEGGVALLR